MSKVQNFLCGIYSQAGLNLKKDDSDVKLLIRNRRKETATKPKKFLLRIDTQKAQYISSLYENKNKSYSLDYKGAKYTFVQNDTADGLKVVIKPLTTKAND